MKVEHPTYYFPGKKGQFRYFYAATGWFVFDVGGGREDLMDYWGPFECRTEAAVAAKELDAAFNCIYDSKRKEIHDYYDQFRRKV